MKNNLKELKSSVLSSYHQRERVRQWKKQLKSQTEEEQRGFSSHQVFSFGLFSMRNFKESKKNLITAYNSIYYACQYLKSPPMQLIEAKMVHIPLTDKKLLLLDLDETLIHFTDCSKDADASFNVGNNSFNFLIRPHCSRFLKNMAALFDVYIFTASTKEYAEPIIAYLNYESSSIKGFFHRKHCLKTKNGLFIKDLRIFAEKDLKDIVIVDNKIYSFSFQLSNGIPVQDFIGNKNDKVLLGLEHLLLQLNKAACVPSFLSHKIKLKQMIKQTLSTYILKLEHQNEVKVNDKTRHQKIMNI